MDKDYMCGDYGTEKNWTEIKVTVRREQLELLTAVMSIFSDTLQIEDYSDVLENTCYGDLIDEKILNADNSTASVSFYLSSDRDVQTVLNELKAFLMRDGMTDATIFTNCVNEEDWANNWKKYYKPLHIGKHFVVVPAWKKYTPKPDEKIIKMDPGMAFGTGGHESTRLVMRMLENSIADHMQVLDIGTGSGILAIASRMLGADKVDACDIDPMSVRVANANFKEAGLDNLFAFESNLLEKVPYGTNYDVICANLVADIIVRMLPTLYRYVHPQTKILCSGIIESRREEVEQKLKYFGYKIVKRYHENDWVGLVVMPDKLDIKALAKKNDVKIVAHRGYSGMEPENSILAFCMAGVSDAYGIETDVHVTADNRFIIQHDDTTLRMTGVEKVLEQTEYDALRENKIYGYYGDSSIQRLPDLMDYLKVLKKYHKHGVLELKNRMTEEQVFAILDKCKDYGIIDNMTFISFSYTNMQHISHYAMPVKFEYLFIKFEGDIWEKLAAIPQMGVDVYHRSLNAETVGRLKSMNKIINCWTVDAPGDAKRLIGLGVNEITTNILMSDII